MELDLNELEKQEGQSPFVSKFQSFFETQYQKTVERLAMEWPQKRSLFVNFSDLEHYDFELADQLLESPDALNEAAEMAVQNIHVPVLETKEFKPHVRFFNIPKDRTPLLRNISSDHLGKLVAVEGVVRQLTDVLPKLHVAAWQCRRCGNVYKREQENDRISMPPMCECKHRDFDLLQEESVFIDNQKIQIQEPLELLKGSEQATILDVIVSDDLVNRVMPGDRTRIVGIIRLRTPKEKNLVYGRFLEAVHLEETAKEFDEVEIAPEEKKEIETLSKNPKIYELLGKSIAPNIYGHEMVKEAIALQLFGGVKKILPNDTNIRGNIHVLLVGDPGCLVADERVVLGNGAIEKIGNLGREHLQEISAQVLTGEGAKKRDLATVFHYYQNQAVMEIVTESGKSIKGTPNHPLLCISKENGRLKRGWKRLDEFKIGDAVAVVTSIPCTIKALIPTNFKPLQKKYGPKFRGKLPTKVTPELAGLLGYLVGDGWITKYKTGFVVNEEERDLLPKLLNATHRLFGIRPVPRPRKLSEGRKVQLYYCEINSEGVAQNLSFLREKRVPDLVLRSGNKAASEFLKWLFEADGCCFCKGRGRRAVSLKAKNIELLRDVQMLLLRFAIHSRITANALQIRRGKDILKYAKHIGFVSKKKKEKLMQLCREAKSFGRFNSQRSEKIVKITQHPPEDVFDIEVPKGHRFIANGIISHNTAKSQMLQSVNKIAPKSIYTAGKTSTGVGLCVAPDSLVLNDGGLRPIQEFVETNFDDSNAKEEIPNAFSNSFQGTSFALSESLDFVSAPIEKIWRIKAPEKMVKIRTRMGRELSLTPATSLTRIKDGQIQWISAENLQPGDFVACAREFPAGREQRILTFTALLDNKNIKVADPLANWIKEITDRLVPKYGSLQGIAKAIGKSRDTLYAVRNPRFYHGWELAKVVKLAREAGFSDGDIGRRIQTLFIRHGKNFRIPQYLDDERLAYLAGLALGDGNYWEGQNSESFRIFSSDAPVLQDASNIIQDLFGIEAEYFDDGKRVPGIRIKFRAICQLLKQFGLAAQKQKIALSHLATEMSNPVLASLLRGLFDTDGYVSNNKKGSSHVGLSTISPQLAKTLHLALLKFGITAKLRLRARAGKIAVGRTISVTSRNDQSCVEIRGKHNLKLFEERIGFRLPRKQEALRKIIASISLENTNVDVVPEIQPHLQETNVNWLYKKGKRSISRLAIQKLVLDQPEDAFLKRLASANVFWDQIKAKEYFEPTYKHVYDFTVKDHHNFIANGFYVHNTASAVKDDFGEGGWTLKAGALVLANGGLAMVDEFDKMLPEDRSAMHEAMEQGMISVAKAGIVTRFKTDTTILAAANPKFARFDQYKNFLEQIDLPPTLISRFDLFFMIFDVLDRKKDEDIAQHILKTHQAGEMTLQRRARGMGKQKEVTEFEESMSPAIAGSLLKKYIAFARQNIFPVLTKEAIQAISDYYVDLRELGKKQGTYTATHRQLEGLVRLSEASARVRLSNTVEKEDTERAIRLLRTSLQELVTDKETGRLDIDMLTSGQSTSQTNQLKGVLGIVQRLNQEHDKVLLEQVFGEAEKIGLDREKTREIISKLKRTGDLYEPSLGIIKAVPKEF